MKALSIRQPWADAIIWHGKDVENRTWSTRYRGPVLIHAAKAWGPREREDLAFVEEMTGTKLEIDKPLLGGIIGRAEIVDCVNSMDSRWFFGPVGFVLRNPEPLPFQPCRGALGFFTPSIATEPHHPSLQSQRELF
ncbi:ASCH domain-containing protein [Salipiger thiooxidans]|uniref:ASCH domain-containing protein n=1 Tax=Salipiger thiooxidans TaxID=282683 RepID=UPI001CD1A7F2|nr:ASCH domain-containing protein [Salipiger thiooxidans]MCA0850378.1 ASCH domain-containing protein [Salipiger thiooxidans]